MSVLYIFNNKLVYVGQLKALFINFSNGKYSPFDTRKVQYTSQNLDGRNPFSFAK